MIREVRLIFLVLLTYLAYALVNLVISGAFIFPFPLNGIVLFVVSFQFTYWHRQQTFTAANIMAIGVFAVLMNLLYWEMILPFESMVSFAESLWTDFFELSFDLAILIFAIRSSLNQNRLQGFILGTLFLALFLIAVFYNLSIFYCLAYATMVLSTYLKPAYAPLHLYWSLLLILEGARLFTFWLNQ